MTSPLPHFVRDAHIVGDRAIIAHHKVYAPGPPGHLNTWCGRNSATANGTADEVPAGGFLCTDCHQLWSSAVEAAERLRREREPEVCRECGRPLEADHE